MSWLSWIAKREETTITVWLCKIHMVMEDYQQFVLPVGPRLDANLQLVQNARTIAHEYVNRSPLFLVDQNGQILPRKDIKTIVFLDRPAQRRYVRYCFFKFFKTSWKKVDTVLSPC